MAYLISAPSIAPGNITTVSTAPEVIYVEWADIPVEHRNGPLIGYKVKYKKYFDKQFSIRYVDFGFTTTELLGLKPFTLYWIEICAYNAAGEGPTDYSIIKTLEGGIFILINYDKL